MIADDILRKSTSDMVVAGRLWRRMAGGVIGRHGIAEAAASPLIWIGRMGEGVRQNALAEMCNIEGPSLVRLIDSLSDNGLVTRTPDIADRRANLLHLTDAGRALAEAIEADLNVLRRQILTDLDPADIEAALRVFAVIKAAAGRIEAPAEASVSG